jgi:acyl-coenzyme A thioesterase 13
VREEGGELVLGLCAQDRHANHRGIVQGGLLSKFADFALGRAIEADADDGRDRPTVSLTVDFLKPARPGAWIESRTRVDRVGGTLAFADCSLTVEGHEIVRAQSGSSLPGFMIPAGSRRSLAARSSSRPSSPTSARIQGR